MAMPLSGQISLGDARTELSADYSPTSQITLNDNAVRSLFTKPGDITNIGLSDGYGKAFRKVAQIFVTTNQTNYSINISTLSGYISGKTDVNLTINSGIYVYATSTSIPALTISGGTAEDTVTLTNNGGYILGAGGRGGDGGGANPARPGGAGSSGGTALSVSRAVRVTNNGVIAGGGGGGGGGGGFNTGDWYGGAGGGGGAVYGAAGARAAWSGAGTGGAGEASAGTLTAGGAGGRTINVSAAGGSGGGWGQPGTNGNGGARGDAPGGAGGAAGKYISGNPSVTWLATGTRSGAVG